MAEHDCSTGTNFVWPNKLFVRDAYVRFKEYFVTKNIHVRNEDGKRTKE